MVFTVAGASEYLAITGYGIPDINIVKKAVIIPGQRCIKFDISPVNYSFEMQSMSKEKLLFSLPVVFTIGPRTDSIESLTKYARLLAPHDKLSQHVKELVLGIIEGETRVLAASMTMEEIFQGTRAFKQEVFEKIQLELDQFGLVIYNANVKQLVDVQGNEYFSYLGKKTQYEAANQAKVDVAEAKMKGEVGAKIRDGEIKQNAAKVEAETKMYSAQREGDGAKAEVKVKVEVKIFETKREAEVAEASAELLLKKASWTRQAKIAEVEAAKAVAIKDVELQIEVERKNVLRQIEKFKADLFSKAIVEYDIKVQEANSELYKKQKDADAMLYGRQKIAEGSKASAEAARFARQQQADADLYATKKKAEGLVALGQAQNDYLNKVMDSVNGNYFALRDYLMINNGIYKDMAKISAEAIHGMQPKISIWNNGAKASDGGHSEDMNGVLRMFPPLIQTVQEQTGMSPPAWMGTLAEGSLN